MTAAIIRLLARLRLVTPPLRYSPPDDGSLRRLVTPQQRAFCEQMRDALAPAPIRQPAPELLVNVGMGRVYAGQQNAYLPPGEAFRREIIREGSEP